MNYDFREEVTFFVLICCSCASTFHLIIQQYPSQKIALHWMIINNEHCVFLNLQIGNVTSVTETPSSEEVTEASSSSLSQGKCVMYGVCSQSDTGLDLNCKIDHGPKPLDPEDVAQLESFCPELIQEHGTNLCCDGHQVTNLITNLQLPQGILGRCPACFNNFRRSFCEFTCSPNQHLFVNVTETTPTPEDELEANPDSSPELVSAVDFFVSHKYVTETYDSCKNVLMSTTNGPAMDLLCGQWGAYRCNAERWFDYMGSISNGYSPFNINYRYMQLPEGAESNLDSPGAIKEITQKPHAVETERTRVIHEKIKPLNPKTYKCSEEIYSTDVEVHDILCTNSLFSDLLDYRLHASA
jgi:hypothetical protein